MVNKRDAGPTRSDRSRPRADRRIVLIVALSVIAVALYSVLVPVHSVFYGAHLALTMLFGAAAVAAPLLSIRFPVVATALFTGSALLLPLMTSREIELAAPWPWSVPMLIAFVVSVVSITFRHGWRPGLIQLILATLAGVTAAVIQPSIPSGNSLIITTSVVSGIYLIAVLLAGRLRLGYELTRERAHTAREQAKRELVEERTRIARELHDVVAHSMSLIQVQASTARYRFSQLPDDAAAEFDEIAASARGALVEMRRTLGVLRTEDHTAELAPQRGLDELPALIETTRRAGAELSLTVSVAGDVSEPTQLAIYRITQEALSNAVRHAPAAPIDVSLSADETDVTLTIHNAHSDHEAVPSGGHGLRGMTERTAILGGSIHAGPNPDGGWTVAARLPRHPLSPPMEGPQ